MKIHYDMENKLHMQAREALDAEIRTLGELFTKILPEWHEPKPSTSALTLSVLCTLHQNDYFAWEVLSGVRTNEARIFLRILTDNHDTVAQRILQTQYAALRFSRDLGAYATVFKGTRRILSYPSVSRNLNVLLRWAESEFGVVVVTAMKSAIQCYRPWLTNIGEHKVLLENNAYLQYLESICDEEARNSRRVCLEELAQILEESPERIREITGSIEHICFHLREAFSAIFSLALKE